MTVTEDRKETRWKDGEKERVHTTMHTEGGVREGNRNTKKCF